VAALVGQGLLEGVGGDGRVALRVSGDADRPRPLRMAGDHVQQLDRGCVGAERRVGVPADEKQIVGARQRHRAQDPVEMIAVADHARGDVDGHVMAHLAQPGRDLDRAVGAVLGRAGDGEAHLLGQLAGLLQAPRKGKDLEARRLERAGGDRGVHLVKAVGTSGAVALSKVQVSPTLWVVGDGNRLGATSFMGHGSLRRNDHEHR
jgi:hypothetical protein